MVLPTAGPAMVEMRAMIRMMSGKARFRIVLKIDS
jgi:hypothetical protein